MQLAEAVECANYTTDSDGQQEIVSKKFT